MFLCFQIYHIRSGLSAAQESNFKIDLFDLIVKENVEDHKKGHHQGLEDYFYSPAILKLK